jgi:hypothetical protein
MGGARKAAAVIAIGGAVLLLSFLALPWEQVSFTSFGTGTETEISNKGPNLGSVYQDDGETGELFVGVTVTASILILLLGLVALAPAMAPRMAAVAIPAGAIALAWLAYSIVWLGDPEMVDGQTGIGATIGWIAAVAVTGASIAAVVVSRRTRPVTT